MPRKILRTRMAGDAHAVHSLQAEGEFRYMKKPCADCPWRKDAAGVFPAEAFMHSAETAFDMSRHVFACHQAGVDRSKACTGFLLKGADHNLAVRMAAFRGEYKHDVASGGHDLFDDYQQMAEANGVGQSDESLSRCRANGK